MPKRRSKRFATAGRWLTHLRRQCGARLRRAWRAVRRWRRPVPLVVLVADPARRRVVERAVRHGLHQLERALRAPLPVELAILVQQVVATDRQLAGCYQVGHRADGSRFALVRLALQVNGKRLTTDELLAALAEQYVGLASRDSVSALVPIDLEPGPPAETRRITALRADPLAPHSIGAARGERLA